MHTNEKQCIHQKTMHTNEIVRNWREIRSAHWSTLTLTPVGGKLGQTRPNSGVITTSLPARRQNLGGPYLQEYCYTLKRGERVCLLSWVTVNYHVSWMNPVLRCLADHIRFLIDSQKCTGTSKILDPHLRSLVNLQEKRTYLGRSCNKQKKETRLRFSKSEIQQGIQRSRRKFRTKSNCPLL